MEADHRRPTFRWVEDVAVSWVAAPGLVWCWTCCQDVLDRVSARATTRGNETDLGDLPHVECRMLRLEINDQLPQM
jgi:hypothetical protein